MTPVTYLFVPATRTDRIAKAFQAGADAVIVDLEDAIAPAEKSAARVMLKGFLASATRPVWVRINAVDTEWFAQDFKLVTAHQAYVAGIMLPKTESSADMRQTSGEIPIIALVESARAILALADICSHPTLHRLAFGSADLSRDLGCEDNRAVLQALRMQLVLHSSAARLPPPIDGVTFDLEAPDKCKQDAADAMRMGFGAKLCIHPAQLQPVAQGFFPTDVNIRWAEKVIQSASANHGVHALDGQMIDKPVIERAEQILQRANDSNHAA